MVTERKDEAHIRNPRDMARSSAWVIAVGVALMLLGLAASAHLMVSALYAVYVVSAAMICAAVLMLANALNQRAWPRRLAWIAGGIIYFVGAVSILYNPVLAAQLITFWLIVAMAISGSARILLALRRDWDWPHMLISGAASLVVAILIARGWPGDAIWMLGLLMAVDLVVQGVALLLVGVALKSQARAWALFE